MSVQALRATFGPNCHWCGLPKHRRLAHAACNHARNEFRMQAERQFRQWIAERQASAKTLNDK